MPYILSPEQKVVVNAILQNKASSNKYFDVICAIQSVCKASTSALAEGKKILIHIKHPEHLKTLKNMFEAVGLNDLTIDLSDKQAMPEVDVIKMRSTLKKQKNSDALIGYVLSDKKECARKLRIDQYYNALDTKVMSDIPFRDFATNAVYKKRNETSLIPLNVIPVDPLTYTPNEYYGVKKEITTAVQLYNRQFDLYDHLTLFKEDIWKEMTAESILKIKDQLKSFQEESAQLMQAFKNTAQTLIDESTYELDNTFDRLQQRFTSNEEASIAYHIKKNSEVATKDGMLSIFKKKKAHSNNKVYIDAFDELSSLIQSISEEWYAELEAPTSEMITYDYIQNFIDVQRQKANDYKVSIRKNLQDSVQRVNKINTSSNAVKNLDKRLEALIDTMNSTALFDIDLEHNILSFVKQVELSEHIADYIERCTILLNSSSSYFEWKSFFNSSSTIFRQLFDVFKKSPKENWINSFEKWYNQHIQYQVIGRNSISSKLLEDYYSQAKTTNQYEVASLIANLHDKRVESVDLLKNTSKELYNTLFKKKQFPGTSWRDTALQNRFFLQSFFPIHITDSLAYANDYDLVMSFSNKNESIVSEAHYLSPIESDDIKNMSGKKNNFLYLNDYGYTRPLSELSSTDKLKAAKKLAKFILSLNQDIKIYQLKNANIISLLPHYDDAFLESQLDKLNVKVIDTVGVLYDRLTESILFTERRPILLLKDELINSELVEHALWQLKIVELFKDVGYKVFSINTCDQLIDNAGQFQAIVTNISGNLPPSPAKVVENNPQLKQNEIIPEEV
ncbi:MAG: hypothetical protein AAGA77_23065 [Bacteroidota bacterium]